MNRLRISKRSRFAVLMILAAVAITPSAILLDRVFGREVLLITPHDEATVKLNRSLHVAGDPVAEIYGNSLSRPVRVVLLTERKVIRPVEDSALALLPVGGNEPRPLQVQTVFFVARLAILGLLLLSLLIAFLPIPGRWSRRTAVLRAADAGDECDVRARSLVDEHSRCR